MRNRFQWISNFAFNCNPRHYIQGTPDERLKQCLGDMGVAVFNGGAAQVHPGSSLLTPRLL